jgi:hypothetical protein
VHQPRQRWSAQASASTHSLNGSVTTGARSAHLVSRAAVATSSPVVRGVILSTAVDPNDTDSAIQAASRGSAASARSMTTRRSTSPLPLRLSQGTRATGPASVRPEIRWHLERFAEPGERGFVFVGPKGGQLRRSNFHKSVRIKAREKVGLPSLHFHDLRHTGGTLTAATGATLKELMARLGHSSVRAAMIYQHATRDRDQAIAKALGTFVRDVRNAAGNQPDTGKREEKEA